MNLHNSHVLKFMRWQIWCAKQSGRQLRETFLIQWHNEELEKSA